MKPHRRRAAVLILPAVLAGGGYFAWMKASEAELKTAEVFRLGLSEIPFATTRGHVLDGELTTGHDRYDYELEGKPPGLKGAPPAKEILIVVHGLNNTAEKARNRFALARESLQHNHYSGVVIGFSWDGSTNWDPFGATGYRIAKHNAMGTAPKLAAFVSDLIGANPDSRIRVLGYSMGARLVCESIHVLATDPRFAKDPARYESVHLVGAALDDEHLQVDERYGRPIEQRVGRFFNYYSPKDSKLGKFYKPLEADRAVGRSDLEEPEMAPRNYRSHDVSAELLEVDGSGAPISNGDRGRNHSAYLGIRDNFGKWRDDGAMDVLIRDIR